MKRMHVGMKVTDLDKAIAFYSRLLGAKPTLQRHDYSDTTMPSGCWTIHG